jgi:capsular polysaccharide biosynthesis protein
MKDKIVNVEKPANLVEEDACMFEPYVSYETPSLKVQNLKGAFITETGLVSNSKGLVRECYHYKMPGQYGERLNEISHYYHAAKENPEKLLTLDNTETYLLIHHTWHNNYYHWICETLLRLWMVKDKIDQMILLLPSESKISRFVYETLEPFKFKSIFHIPNETGVLVRTLCMPQLKPSMASYNHRALFFLKKLYIDYTTHVKHLELNFGERIYLSRAKSSRRKIVNEIDVENTLKVHDFNIIYNEDYSFYQQVALYSNAKYLVSIHGAGLTNILFMPTSSKVLEFHKRNTNPKDHHSFVFWYLADALSHNYYHQICEPANHDDDFFEADFIVDIELLKRNLKLMLQ